jgi:RimJ/RimL family protein N-acetyltransferase
MNAVIDISDVVLKTKRLILRSWTVSDLDDFFEYASVDGVGQMAGWLPHQNKEESSKILNNFIAGKKTFALEHDGKVIGSLGIEQYSEKAAPEFDDLAGREIGYVLSKDYWGQGFMPEAVNEVIRYLFEVVRLDVIFCGYFLRNKQSARVQEKCGFSFYKKIENETRYGTLEPTNLGILCRDDWIAKNTDNQTLVTESLPAVRELPILVTDVDKYGVDIAAMSDFFDGYIQQLTCELRSNSVVVELANIPAADIGLINDVVHQMDAVLDGTYSYLPDFDHLPRDIKARLDKGIYKLGESRQVDGNLRPVILDENGVRVKDVTLKEVINDHGTLETTRNVFNQLQMRQLFAKLDNIQELQSYQIDRDRDRDIVTPFLNARDNILRAQNQGSNEARHEYLSKAVAELTSAINAVYTDMETASSHLLKLTRRPIFQRFDQIKNYIEFLARDIQLSTKFVGVQTHVLNYLGDSKSATLELERFRHIVQGFFSKPLGARRISAAMLIHQYFPYTDENRNSWITLSKEIGSMLQSEIDLLENKKVILVSAEEADNAE